MKRISIRTVLVGFFWLLSVLYWTLTLIVWLLSNLGFIESLFTYGLFFVDGYFFPIAIVELAVVTLPLVVYFAIHDEALQKKWLAIIAGAVGFSYMLIIIVEGIAILFQYSNVFS